ncbi:MAG: SpoIIE family protein phosphatase [Bacteroidetes bacterium]|nr:SpoIIE family protein phosphatase [Bacteroidota bacterium]
MKTIIYKRINLVLLLSFLCFNLFTQEQHAINTLISNLPTSNSFEIRKEYVRNINDSLKLNGNVKIRYLYLSKLSQSLSNTSDYLLFSYTNNLLGLLYNNIGKYNSAVECFDAAINAIQSNISIINDKENSQIVLHLVYLNYGNTFYYLGDYPKALLYYKKSLSSILKKGLKDKADSVRVSQVYNNFGIMYNLMKLPEEGAHYFQQSLNLNVKLKDTVKIANVLSNLASLQSNKQEHDSALKLYFIVKAIYEKGDDKADLAFVNSEIATVYLEQEQPQKALKYALTALSYCDIEAMSFELVSVYNILSKTYANLKDYKNENIYIKKYYAALDSVKAEEVLNNLQNKEQQEEFVRIHYEDSLKTAHDLSIKDIKIEEKKKETYLLVTLVLVILLALILIFKRFQLTKKQKQIIEEQKLIVDLRNKEVIDSINYAKRLQSAILPSNYEINKLIGESFLLFKPKDIVSGDFYFVEEYQDCLFIAAADCTGHGVPGAMLTIACYNAMQSAIFENSLTQPGLILDFVRDRIEKHFNKSSDSFYDGMDISLIVLNKTEKKVMWSGANNKLLFVVNNSLMELKADRQPVGKSDKKASFTTHFIESFEGTVFYLFTDGLIDQFGGDKGKKFSILRLKKLIESTLSFPLNKQFELVTNEFTNWSNGVEQTDDVTLLVFKI